MSQGPLCPNLSQKVQKEVSQMANHNLSCVILLGGLSVNLNHLKTVWFLTFGADGADGADELAVVPLVDGRFKLIFVCRRTRVAVHTMFAALFLPE